jgi:hypothetical protein
MADALKLRARDAEDLAMVAALLQDALVALADIKYLGRERRFALMVNRFRWETLPGDSRRAGSPPSAPGDASFADQGAAGFERVHSALVFDRVRSVKHRGLTSGTKAGVLVLLNIHLDGSYVFISFAGGAEIRLEVERFSCHLEDLGEPWPTVWRPEHSQSETSGGPA